MSLAHLQIPHPSPAKTLFAHPMQIAKTLFRKFLGSGGYARNVSILAGGTAASQALAICVTPLLTRLYPVEDFGYLQLYLSCMAFAIMAATLRYEQAILLPELESTALSLVAVSALAVCLLTSLFALLATALYRTQSLPHSLAVLGPFRWIAVFGMFAAGIYQTLNFWALRQRAYNQVAQTKFTQVLTQLAAQLALGWLHLGAFGFLFGDALGRMGGTLTLTRLLWRRSRATFASLPLQSLWSAAVRYRRFPLVSCGSALINTAGFALPAIVIAQFYGAKSLGWYALSDRLLAAPIMLIGQAVSQVYAVEIASLSVNNPQAMHLLFLKSIQRLALFGIVPLLLFAIFSPWVFSVLFGAAWKESGIYARILSLSYYFAFISWPVTPTLNILEKQFWQLSWDISRLALTLGTLLLAHRLGCSARSAIALFSVAMMAGYLAHLFLSDLAIRRKGIQASQGRSSGVIPPQIIVNPVEL